MARASRRSSPSSPPSTASTAANGDGRGKATPPAAPVTPPDPIAGLEVAILTQMLGDPKKPDSVIGKANAGDATSIDRAVKILDLRRRYLDRQDVARAATLDDDDE